MQRLKVQFNPSNLMSHYGLSDVESLLVQLAEFLARSGFAFDDAKDEEIGEGHRVIALFYEQEPNLVKELLIPNAFERLELYIQSQKWGEALLQKKLRQRLLKAWDQLILGQHQILNIRRNVHLGLMQRPSSGLHEFLLYLQLYYILIVKAEQKPATAKNFNPSDILKMRQEIMDKLERYKFVSTIIEEIKHKRGGALPKENLAVLQSNSLGTIEFFRPSETLGVTAPPPQKMMAPMTGGSSSTFATANTAPPAMDSKKGSVININEVKASDDMISEDDLSDRGVTDKKIDLDNLGEDDDINSTAEVYDDTQSDVIYGSGQITQESAMDFIQQHPESAIKFLFLKELDGKPSNPQSRKIYEAFEKRGLRRGFIKKNIMQFMNWQKMPEITVDEIARQVKDRIFDLTHGYIKE